MNHPGMGDDEVEPMVGPGGALYEPCGICAKITKVKWRPRADGIPPRIVHRSCYYAQAPHPSMRGRQWGR